MLKWKPELIINGLKIMCMKMEHLVFLDSVYVFPCALRKPPEAFGLSPSKSWYLHTFNTVDNLDYVGPIPDISYYGANEMREDERREFLVRYESQRPETFDNRRVLETHSQDDVHGPKACLSCIWERVLAHRPYRRLCRVDYNRVRMQ